MKTGRLLAFEGIDGCGKSTQLARVATRLRDAGHDVVETREPTDGETGRRIRAMARSGEPPTPREELAWFVADRGEHVEHTIAPALAAGRIVLCDRYTLSSVAYQGARGLDPLEILADGEARFPIPDLVLLFEIDPDRAFERIRARGGVAEPSFELRDFQAAVAAVFESLACPYITRIDAAGDVASVQRLVLSALRDRLGLP